MFHINVYFNFTEHNGKLKWLFTANWPPEITKFHEVTFVLRHQERVSSAGICSPSHYYVTIFGDVPSSTAYKHAWTTEKTNRERTTHRPVLCYSAEDRRIVCCSSLEDCQETTVSLHPSVLAARSCQAIDRFWKSQAKTVSWKMTSNTKHKQPSVKRQRHREHCAHFPFLLFIFTCFTFQNNAMTTNTLSKSKIFQMIYYPGWWW